MFVERVPRGVIAIAVLFLLVSAYLLGLTVLQWVSPDSVSLTLGTPLLHGLELAGPFMFLITAGIAAVVGFALLRLRNLGRRAAIVIALAGAVLLIPKVSADSSDFSLRFFLAGSGITIRVMIVWYLWQSRVVEQFR